MPNGRNCARHRPAPQLTGPFYHLSSFRIQFYDTRRVQKLIISYRSQETEKVSFSYYLTAPATATSLVFPELPDTLAAFRPSAYSSLSLETMKFDKPIAYSNFLNAISNYNGRFYEAAGLKSYGYAGISIQP